MDAHRRYGTRNHNPSEIGGKSLQPISTEDELDSELEKLARLQHRTKSDLVRDMLRKRIAVEKFRALRRQALPLAEAAGFEGTGARASRKAGAKQADHHGIH